MPDNLVTRITELLNTRPWYKLPRLLGMRRLIDIRNELREKNLHDTEEPPLERRDPSSVDPAIRAGRTIDGTHNDLQYPQMGAVGRRFGRNVPLEHVFPDAANLLVPNPRVVSRTLMTRTSSSPATMLNLLAAAWIQFMVHDWFVHARSTTEAIDIPAADGDDWGAPSIRVPRTLVDHAPAGSTRPPAYANLNSHWWDSSQIYGCDPVGGREAQDEDGRTASHRTDGAPARRSRDRCALHRIHRQLVDRAGDAPHDFHARAQPYRRPLRRSSSELDRRPDLCPGEARERGADGQDSHGGVDTGHHPAPADPHGHARELVGARRRGSSGRPRVPGRQGLLGGVVGSHGGSSCRALLAHRRVRGRVPDAPADSGPGGLQVARHRAAAGDTRARRGLPASERRSSPSASRCPTCSTPSARRTPVRSRCTTIPVISRTSPETTASAWIWRRWTSCAIGSAACPATTSSASCSTSRR